MERTNVRNALNPQILEDLSTAFSDLHQEKNISAVVLSGSGDHFCSGMDLQVFKAIGEMETSESLSQWHSLWRRLAELYEQMLRFPKPIIAAVDGGAIDAGLGLVLASDLMILSDNAYLASPAILHGLMNGPTAALLHFRYGSNLASRLLLTGQHLDASEAYRIGVCPKPVSPDQIWVTASDLGKQCARAPREAQQATKQLLNDGCGEFLFTQLAAAAARSAAICTTDSAKEGILAFLEKRTAVWP